MPPETILVQNLSKTYQVPEREGGFGAAVRSFFKRKYKDVKAVQEVNFNIKQGEIVGFLGPNGAGKTTTLKMLSGLLHRVSHLPRQHELDRHSKHTTRDAQQRQAHWQQDDGDAEHHGHEPDNGCNDPEESASHAAQNSHHEPSLEALIVEPGFGISSAGYGSR